ncbi:MAG: hypothetical protein RIT25_2738, partial [Planctomycetota bacterium]
MRSFVLGMLIAAVVCLLWVFFRSAPEVQGGAAAQAEPTAHAAGPESLLILEGESSKASIAQPQQQTAQQPAAPQQTAQQPAPQQPPVPQPAPLAEGVVPAASLATASAADIGACWRELADAATAPGRRAAVAAALGALPVATLEQAMAKLGATNATLRSDEGRQVVQRAAELAASLPDEQSVVALSRLVERLMQGPVDRTNPLERGAVDQVYDML